MASGHPFIATNVNGLREVVQGAGELFELGNAQELADIILRLEADKEYYNFLSEKCSERARLYDIHQVEKKYMNEYLKHVK